MRKDWPLRQWRKLVGPKIFCIGFNKTGTSSLNRFFLAHGMISLHHPRWTRYSWMDDGYRYLRESQCFTDGETPCFYALDKWFPNALFILNTRSERPWLHSRVKHVLRYGVPTAPECGDALPQYGEMAKKFFAAAEEALESWIIERRIYEKRARVYFDANPRFLEISVPEDPQWSTRLQTFLLDNGIKLRETPAEKPIHANVRGNAEVPDQEALTYYLALADKKLAERPAAV